MYKKKITLDLQETLDISTYTPYSDNPHSIIWIALIAVDEIEELSIGEYTRQLIVEGDGEFFYNQRELFPRMWVSSNRYRAINTIYSFIESERQGKLISW
jgi:hypothetical protein